MIGHGNSVTGEKSNSKWRSSNLCFLPVQARAHSRTVRPKPMDNTIASSCLWLIDFRFPKTVMFPIESRLPVKSLTSIFALLSFLAAMLALAPTTNGAAAQKILTTEDGSILHPGLDIKLFAAEPEVVDPVGLTFDEEGRMYVVEMRDYPLGIGPEHRPGGTIRLLEDQDGDGRADRSVVFAEGLRFPTSIAAWNGGVLVTAPPEILFLKDTDGDGKADVREVMLKGFTLGVTDSNVNGLRWGLDNRVHGGNGGNGGAIISLRKSGAPVALENDDFSFDPSTGDFSLTYRSGEGFGLVFDEWGRSFVPYNINHIQHRVIPVRYLRRFPGLPPVDATVSISDHEEMSRIYPISTPETRPNHPEQAGHFSSAGGMGFIGIPDYPGDLPRSILVCDVVGNLVHRDVLIEEGPSFIAKRSPEEQRKEFFASRDNSCRPIGMELGPDGALYLIDMQRDVIEHPDYIPEKVKQKINLRAGEDRGRIYRITPKGGRPPRKPKLSGASVTELVQALSNSNQWWRVTAQRLLFERQDKAAIPQLRQVALTNPEPLGRLHALWTLQGLHALDEEIVLRGLADQHPGIRENCLLFAETFAQSSTRIQNRILALAKDSSPRVRFQTALTIGQFDRPEANGVLLQILRRDFSYRWTRLAVLSSLRRGEDALLRALLTDAEFRSDRNAAKLALVGELADLTGARTTQKSPNGATSVLTTLAEIKGNEMFQIAALDGLRAGLSRSAELPRATSEIVSILEKISASGSVSVMEAAWMLSRTLKLPEIESQRKALAQAGKIALDSARPEADRRAQIRLLALGKFEGVGTTLFELLAGTQPSSIQSAAIEVLRDFGDAEVGKSLVEKWSALSPQVRSAAIDLLLRRRVFHEPLIAAIETGRVRLGELNLDLEQRRVLLRHSTPEIQARASKLFGDEEYSNRKGVADDWLKKLPAAGDARRGRAVFEKTCAQCHLVDGVGVAVGPNLSDMSHRSVEDLLYNILDPNMAINPSYVSYNAELDSGELVSGILQAESSDAITLLQPQGVKLVLARKQIKRFESSGLSLMPEGLEASMTPVDMRDLIAFLQSRQ